MRAIVLGLFAAAFTAGLVASASIGAGARILLLDGAVGAVLFYCAWLQRGNKRFLPPLWPPIIAFAVAGFVSVFINAGNLPLFAQGAGLLYLVRWLWYAALYWAAAGGTIPPRAWLTALWSGGVGIAVLGLVQYWLYPDLRNLYYLGWDPHMDRLFSTLFDPNFAGLIFVLSLLAGSSLLSKKSAGRQAVLAGQLILAAALLLTYSRSSYVALAAAGATVAWYDRRLRRMVAVAAVVFFMLLLLLPKTGEGRNLLREASVSARLTNMRTGLTLFSRSPVVGYGFNTLRFLSAVPTSAIPSHAVAGFDMSLIFILATGGVVGLAAFLWLIGRMASVGKKEMWYMAALVAVGSHSLFVNSFFYPWVMAFVFIWTGVIHASRAAR